MTIFAQQKTTDNVSVQKLNKTFASGQVLKKSELQDIVNKIDEVIVGMENGSSSGGSGGSYSLPLITSEYDASSISFAGIFTNVTGSLPSTAETDADTSYTVITYPNEDLTQLAIGNTSGKVWFRAHQADDWTLKIDAGSGSSQDAIDAAKAEIIGTDSDTSYELTIYGTRKYAKSVANTEATNFAHAVADYMINSVLPNITPISSESTNAGNVTTPGIYTNMTSGRPTTASADGDTSYTLFVFHNGSYTQLAIGNTSGKVWFRASKEDAWTLLINPTSGSFMPVSSESVWGGGVSTPGVYTNMTSGRPTTAGADGDTSYTLIAGADNTLLAVGNVSGKLWTSSDKGTTWYQCVRNTWKDKDSIINVLDASCVTDRVSKLGAFIVSDDNNNVSDTLVESVTVTSDNYYLLRGTLVDENKGLAALMESYEAYYKVGDSWYSQNIKSYLTNKPTRTPSFKVGDRLLIFKRHVKPSYYLRDIIDFDSIECGSSATDKLAFAAYKASFGLGSYSDGDFIKYLMDDGQIYGKDDYDYPLLDDDGYIVMSDFVVVDAETCREISSAEFLAPSTEEIEGTHENFADLDATNNTYEFFQGWWNTPSETASLRLATVPSGLNLVDVWGFWREGLSAVSFPDESAAYIEAVNSNNCLLFRRPLRTLASEPLSAFPDNQSEARAAFDKDRYRTTFLFNNNSGGDVDLYVRVSHSIDRRGSWCCVGGVSVSAATSSSTS